MKALLKAANLVNKICEVIAESFLIIMILIVFTQVILRYCFNYGLHWVEEVSLLLMVWFGFISIAIGVREKLHIGIEMFIKKLPEKTQDVITRAGYGLIFVFAILMTVFGWGLVQSTSTSTLPATSLPSSTLYVILPISGVMILFNSLVIVLGLDKCDKEEK